MKKVMIMLVSAMLATATIQAQDAKSAKQHRTPEEKAKMMTEKMDKKLDLTDAQEAKVLDIYTTFARKKAELRKNSGTDKSATQSHMKALKDDIDNQLRAILTPEQWTKKEQLEAQRKEKHSKNHEHKGHKGHNGQNKQK